MPCDSYSNTHVSDIFVETLDAIEHAINENTCDAYILCGDFNTSFHRDNAQTRFLSDFISRNNIKLSWDSPISSCGYTYTNYSLNHMSCIDHFIVTDNIFTVMKHCQVHYDPVNPSNHNVISMSFLCNVNNVIPRNVSPSVSGNRCAWHRANDDNIDMYKCKLDLLLSDINIPNDVILCSDVLCDNSAHKASIDNFCRDILKCCLESGTDSIPLRKLSNRSVPGWKECVKPDRDRSLFWHWIWLECGKPNSGYTYDIMKRTRSQYHYAVRCAKRQEFEIQKQKLAENANDSTDMWKELKKINPICRNIPTTVDNACCPNDIAELFVSKYENLFNSVPTNDTELEEISQIVKSGLSESNCAPVNISPDIICKCIAKLKAGKSDGNQCFDSDHLLNGTAKLFNLLSLLFNVMILSHGHTANDLLYSTIVSIPKNLRASLCTSDNYRGIALCCSLCKVLDLAILDQYGKYLYTSDLQFGFKAGHSTTLCTAMYIETVDYYLRKKSDVFSCLLDASKAFDKVHYDKLFKLLLLFVCYLIVIRVRK